MTLERVPPLKPLSPMQTVIVTLVAMGATNKEIATYLHIQKTTVAVHLRDAAKRIPGDLPRRFRVIAWARGATLDVLTGTQLKLSILESEKMRPMGDLLPTRRSGAMSSR